MAKQGCLKMSQSVETGGVEGSGEDDELAVWLNKHNLTKYESKFREDNVKLTEFMEYTDQDIEL